MKRAIVLSGGGAQGAYQLGVWKALKRLYIDYDIVTGTSVGAMNGALMVQKDYLKALWMWYHLDFSLVFNLPVKHDYETPVGKKEIIKMYAKNILNNGGMDVSRLEETVYKALNVKKFYKSKIDYGLVTVKLPELRPITLTKREIPKHQLKDYIIASATCFPAFKKKQIDDSKYIDGGYYDNLPINLAIDMGAEEIIAVDLNTIGLKKRVKKSDAKITYITPRNKLGSFLIFQKNLARRNIRYGYNDTMKVFKKLDGDKYTFKKNNLKKNLNKYQYKFINILNEIFNLTKDNKTLKEKLLQITNYYQMINGHLKLTEITINETIEYVGKVLGLNDSKIYDIRLYNYLLVNKLKEIDDINLNLIEQKIKNNDIMSLFDTSLIIKYIYNKLLMMNENEKIKKELSNLSLIVSKEFLAAIYIFVIDKK